MGVRGLETEKYEERKTLGVRGLKKEREILGLGI